MFALPQLPPLSAAAEAPRVTIDDEEPTWTNHRKSCAKPSRVYATVTHDVGHLAFGAKRSSTRACVASRAGRGVRSQTSSA